MPAPSPFRQSFPYWQVQRGRPGPPTRGAKVVPFPRARARQARVVTYQRVLTLPERPAPAIDEAAESRAATIAGCAVAMLVCVMLALA